MGCLDSKVPLYIKSTIYGQYFLEVLLYGSVLNGHHLQCLSIPYVWKRIILVAGITWCTQSQRLCYLYTWARSLWRNIYEHIVEGLSAATNVSTLLMSPVLY